MRREVTICRNGDILLAGVKVGTYKKEDVWAKNGGKNELWDGTLLVHYLYHVSIIGDDKWRPICYTQSEMRDAVADNGDWIWNSYVERRNKENAIARTKTEDAPAKNRYCVVRNDGVTDDLYAADDESAVKLARHSLATAITCGSGVETANVWRWDESIRKYHIVQQQVTPCKMSTDELESLLNPTPSQHAVEDDAAQISLPLSKRIDDALSYYSKGSWNPHVSRLFTLLKECREEMQDVAFYEVIVKHHGMAVDSHYFKRLEDAREYADKQQVGETSEIATCRMN